ncbi:purine-nucleoside phosphorylase [Parenemella sanctibonifatiensis]|uniref:Purine-nucleoside phosphorylase n=1 Tax=Parenemella sanctibonifatiensis TaxID=2016505 RepID=A0A255E8L6_9ACTN|nr:purine-nucleoside phosphorylase [Parenemella sanctibonifatiensis]OYN87899.1 purine-nucleoside phosphorylase [Parenemella sanctibonifatiensis]
MTLITDAADQLREAAGGPLRAGVVLGSGWAAAADALGTEIARFPLSGLPGFRAPTVAGHGGEAIIVRVADQPVVVFTGRTHLYEGHGTDAVVHGVRVLAAAGADRIILTNGCGGLNPDWPAGTVVALRDHINLTGASPLSGPTFVDLTEAYSPELRARAQQVDPLPEGVYAQFRGPQYETPAEVRMAGILGADLVGMSTVVETIAARAAGLQVLALSLVTNPAAGTVAGAALDHADVVAAGRAAGDRLAALMAGIVSKVVQ